MRYRLEKLNRVQYADDEERRAKLEAEGFQVVNAEGNKKQEEGKADSSGSKKKPAESAKAGKKQDTVKKQNKEGNAEKTAEDAGTGEKSDAAERENADAG